MARKVFERYEKLTDGKYEETYYTEEPLIVYKALAHCLAAQYIHKAPWIKRIAFRCNYDETNTITVYESNGGKRTITYES